MDEYYRNLKKSKYRALLYKMQSISSKSDHLENKLADTKSLLKTTFVIDNEILNEDSYNELINNCNSLGNNVNSTISHINSQL